MILDENIFGPNYFTSGGIEASQLAHCAEGVKFAIVKRGCGAGPFLSNQALAPKRLSEASRHMLVWET